jgi:glycosyltransferase involved in cell wall biosynthesis
MKLQAVTVCVNYADFFEETGAANKGIFDKFVVVTDIADTEVTALCAQFGYECVKTDVFYENGASFNKYAGINEGLKLIDDDAWVCFIDSDIVLMPETRRVLENRKLYKDVLYGIDRVNCVGYEAWDHYKSGKGVLRENWMLNSAGLELGSRLVHIYGQQGENGRFEGWRPLGFFQLCQRSAFTSYPQETAGADHCDLVFARQWSLDNRFLLPELLGIHLESERCGTGVNWYGRKSAPFVSRPVMDLADAAPSQRQAQTGEASKPKYTVGSVLVGILLIAFLVGFLRGFIFN